MMKSSPPHASDLRLPGARRIARPIWACALAAIAATTLVAYWASHDLPISLRLRPAERSVSGAPLPPALERLFGPPLRRIFIDEQTPEFEPEAYARYYSP